MKPDKRDTYFDHSGRNGTKLKHLGGGFGLVFYPATKNKGSDGNAPWFNEWMVRKEAEERKQQAKEERGKSCT